MIEHYRKFHEFFQTESAIQAEQIISENRTALFNTHQMLIDWRESQTSTRKEEANDIDNESGNTKTSSATYRELMEVYRTHHLPN